MSGYIAYIGSMTLGQCVPLALTAQGYVSAAAGMLMPELAGKVEGLIKVQAALTVKPPSLAANIEAVAKVAAALSVAIEGPTVTLQVSAIAGLIAELNLAIGQIQLQLDFAANLAAMLGTAGIFGWVYEGPTSGLGAAVGSETSSGFPGGAPGDQCHVLILGTRQSTTWATMSGFFKVAA